MDKSDALIILFCFVGGLIRAYQDYKREGFDLYLILSFIGGSAIALLILVVLALLLVSIVTLFS